MQKTIHGILTLIVIAVFTLSCTRNNGDIGEYFGTWKVESITLNEVKDATYTGNLFWGFQASVFSMKQVGENHSSTQCWGTWEDIDGKILRIDFTHQDNLRPEGSPFYTPLPVSYLSQGVSDLTILSLSGSEMNLEYINNEGTRIKYKLKKW